MMFKRSELVGAWEDNFRFWKIVVPILLASIVAGLAVIEFARGDHPFVFLGWSITCFISGVLSHRRWSRPGREQPSTAGEWS
jgi:hypothetical protein